ncbi:MAG: segregation and condensation protein A [Gammaproteobacteria bacterium]|nr:segregation and condensation protein A [Gammaproteobacteria bacterium]
MSKNYIMNNNELSKDQKILIALRKTLSGVVRETTPPPGMRHPLTEQTIEDIKHCFSLIAAREKELTEEKGQTNTARPRYTDEPKSSHVVPFTRPEKK